MRTHTSVAQRMFAALAAEKINMKMITTGDIKISVLVDKADGVRALRAVHEAFGLHLPEVARGFLSIATICLANGDTIKAWIPPPQHKSSTRSYGL